MSASSRSRGSAGRPDLGIVIVGAGLVGPVAAMYLAPRYGQVTVLERRADPRSDSVGGRRSLMVILSYRSWRVLRELGLADRVRDICVPLKGRCGHLPSGGAHFTAYSRRGEPIWAVERARLQCLLLDAAQATPGVDLCFRHQVSEVDLDAPAVRIGEGAGRRWVSCEHVLGCDGVRSAVRAALVAQGVRHQVSTLELAYQEISLRLADCDRDTMHYWPTGDALFGAFPTLAAGQFAGSVFFRLDGPPPSYASVSARHPLVDQFTTAFPAVARQVPDLASQLAAKPVSIVPLARCEHWVWGGAAALVGDSCHAMAPFMGQGMNCAFEDARTLVGCLDQSASWPDALARYERLRKAEGDAIAEISYAHYRTMSHLPGAADDAAAVLAERLCGLFPDRFTPLYEACAFSDASYAAARRDDRRLQALTRDLLGQHGADLLASSDQTLSDLLTKHGGSDDRRSVPVPFH